MHPLLFIFRSLTEIFTILGGTLYIALFVNTRFPIAEFMDMDMPTNLLTYYGTVCLPLLYCCALWP